MANADWLTESLTASLQERLVTLNILNLPHCYETSRLLHFHISRVCYCSVCDETQKSAETGYGTFFGTKFSSRPIPRLFSVLNFPKADSGSFPVPFFFLRKGYKRFEKVMWESLETGKFQDRDQIFPRPAPRIFSVPICFRDRFQDFFGTNFFETGSQKFLVREFPGLGCHTVLLLQHYYSHLTLLVVLLSYHASSTCLSATQALALRGTVTVVLYMNCWRVLEGAKRRSMVFYQTPLGPYSDPTCTRDIEVTFLSS